LITCKNTSKKGEIPVTTASEEAQALFEQARDFLDNLETAKAIELLDQAIEKDPKFALAYLNRATAGGGYQVYRENLEKAVANMSHVSDGEKHLILYQKASADGEGAKQKQELEYLLTHYPNDKWLHHETAVYFYWLSDFKKSLEHNYKATQIDPSFAAAYNMIGYANLKLENYDGAEKAFKTYIELIPDRANPYDSYAEMLLSLGRYDESIEQYQKAYDSNKNFIEALAGIGSNYVLKGNFDEARKYYEKKLNKATLVNYKFSALSEIIASYVEQGDIDKALKTCERRALLAKEIGISSYKMNSHQLAGFICTETGKYEDAAEHYDQAARMIKIVAMNEMDKESMTWRANVYNCYLLTAQGKIEEAGRETERCLKIAQRRQNPDEMQIIHQQLASLELKRNNHDEALKHMEETNMEDPYNWYLLALAHAGQGNENEAKDLFSKVANCNEVRLGLALVRGRAKSKL
jgi:tetratricopeptide (TPR) repeat protein